MNSKRPSWERYIAFDKAAWLFGSVALILSSLVPLGCVEATLLGMRSYEWSLDTMESREGEDARERAKGAIKFVDFVARHPGPAGRGDAGANRRIHTSISFEARSRDGESWSLSAARCKLVTFSHAKESDGVYTKRDESDVLISLPYPNVGDGVQVEKFSFGPQEVTGCSLVFDTEGYDICVLLLPFESETGRRRTCKLLFSASGVSRHAIDQLMAMKIEAIN